MQLLACIVAWPNFDNYLTDLYGSKRALNATIQTVDTLFLEKFPLPSFKKMGTKWKGAGGFAAILLQLSCLGSAGEYVLWDETARDLMAEKEWKRRKFKSTSKPPILHRHCEDVVTSTSIASLAGDQLQLGSCESLARPPRQGGGVWPQA